MTLITVQHAKTQLSRLLKRVEAGEDIVIARGRTPVARLVGVGAPGLVGRVFGAAKGQYAPPPPGAFAPLGDDDLSDWE